LVAGAYVEYGPIESLLKQAELVSLQIAQNIEKCPWPPELADAETAKRKLINSLGSPDKAAAAVCDAVKNNIKAVILARLGEKEAKPETMTYHEPCFCTDIELDLRYDRSNVTVRDVHLRPSRDLQ